MGKKVFNATRTRVSIASYMHDEVAAARKKMPSARLTVTWPVSVANNRVG